MKLAESIFKLRAGEYTSKEVLEDVIERIERQPKRLWMPTWVAALRGRIKKGTGITRSALPECGTAACVGGHIGLSFGLEVKDGEDARKLLKLPPPKVLSGCGCSLCAKKREEGETRQEAASRELMAIFGRTLQRADQIVPALKGFVENYGDILARKNVVVKTRKELREERQR